MKIPFAHYIRFWSYKSALAIGTGFLIAYMSFNLLGFVVDAFNLPMSFLLISPIIFFLFFTYSQIIVAKSFWGRARGKFEYSHLEYKLKNDTKVIANRILSKRKYYGTLNEKLSYIVHNSDAFNKEIIECNIDLNGLKCFQLFFKAKAAIKEKDYNIAINSLKKAKSLRPNDLILNYWLGRIFEYTDEQESAVAQYNIAQEIAKNISSCISDYLDIEKERVELRGCKSEPKLLGFRYGSF